MTSQSHRDGGRYRYLQPTSALSFDNPNIPAQAYCSTVLLSWSGGVPPYDLQIINVNPPGEQLEDFPGLTGTSMEWLAGGKVQQKNVIAKIIDSTGASAQTQQIPVGPGSPNECIQQQKVTPTSTSSTPPPTTTNRVSPVRPSTTPSPTPVPTTTSTSQTTTKGSSSATASAASTSSTSPSLSSPSSAPNSTSISSTSTTSASATTTNSQSQQPSSPTSAPARSIASSPSMASTSRSTSSSSASPPPGGLTKPPRTPSPRPGVKAAIAIVVIVLVAVLGAIIFWLRRRAVRRRKLVRSSGERADLNQESRPLLAELESPGRALVAQRAWAGSSPPWASGQGGGGTFNPDDDSDDNVLVIQRHPPRSTDAQASGWQSDFTPATATTMTTSTRTSAGRPSLLSTTTTTRIPLPEDRYADSPIDPLLVRRGSTRPSSHVLPSAAGTNATSDLGAFDAMLEAEAASRTRAGRLTGTEIDSAVDSASEREEWDALSASDTRTVRTLPPPYQHHSM
ncbi:hypothetical protein GSI_08595 [Ganoderma sinense ZZ0214-1]|uniref:Uncharacterized protein n=1 Tax=Ganoderma sinense ZZ0214-1 TaxID=1077348 RepID=A0A2G8S493_9APHY|nr:hypothetical protein GSI_08595 [Ganoderma sinense ZZ0214-1]